MWPRRKYYSAYGQQINIPSIQIIKSFTQFNPFQLALNFLYLHFCILIFFWENVNFIPQLILIIMNPSETIINPINDGDQKMDSADQVEKAAVVEGKLEKHDGDSGSGGSGEGKKKEGESEEDKKEESDEKKESQVDLESGKPYKMFKINKGSIQKVGGSQFDKQSSGNVSHVADENVNINAIKIKEIWEKKNKIDVDIKQQQEEQKRIEEAYQQQVIEREQKEKELRQINEELIQKQKEIQQRANDIEKLKQQRRVYDIEEIDLQNPK